MRFLTDDILEARLAAPNQLENGLMIRWVLWASVATTGPSTHLRRSHGSRRRDTQVGSDTLSTFLMSATRRPTAIHTPQLVLLSMTESCQLDMSRREGPTGKVDGADVPLIGASDLESVLAFAYTHHASLTRRATLFSVSFGRLTDPAILSSSDIPFHSSHVRMGLPTLASRRRASSTASRATNCRSLGSVTGFSVNRLTI